MIMLLATQALALDCTTFTGESCPHVNQINDIITDINGPQVMHDNAAPRLRPATIYGRFETLRAAVADAGCDAAFYADGGLYDGLGQGVGAWEVIGDSSTNTPFDVTIDFANRTFVGFDGFTTYGNVFAHFNSGGKLLSQWNAAESWVGGFWVRTYGKNGIWVAVESSGTGCPSSAEADLAAWFNTP